MSCQSVSGMAGTVVSTRRATTLAFAQSGSIVAIRATLARTAMIFAARSDPRAIVLSVTAREAIAQEPTSLKMKYMSERTYFSPDTFSCSIAYLLKGLSRDLVDRNQTWE